MIDDDAEAWFWTARVAAGEREATQIIAAGRDVRLLDEATLLGTFDQAHTLDRTHGATDGACHSLPGSPAWGADFDRAVAEQTGSLPSAPSLTVADLERVEPGPACR